MQLRVVGLIECELRFCDKPVLFVSSYERSLDTPGMPRFLKHSMQRGPSLNFTFLSNGPIDSPHFMHLAIADPFSWSFWFILHPCDKAIIPVHMLSAYGDFRFNGPREVVQLGASSPRALGEPQGGGEAAARSERRLKIQVQPRTSQPRRRRQ